MAESTVTADSKLTSSDTRRRIWAIVGASSGNLVEWFDFYVYSFCSLYFAHIIHTDNSIDFLRPCLSAMRPNSQPPIGRIRNPAAKTPAVCSS